MFTWDPRQHEREHHRSIHNAGSPPSCLLRRVQIQYMAKSAQEVPESGSPRHGMIP
jgi:hypothetical protein